MYAILIFLTLLCFTQSNPIAGNCVGGNCQISDHEFTQKAGVAAPSSPSSRTGPVKRVGSYEVLCGANNEHIADVVNHSRLALVRAIRDLNSRSPRHGYEQLFGVVSPADVKGILQKIVAGSSATLVPAAGDSIHGSTVRISPTIACMDTPTASLYNHPSYLKNVCRNARQTSPFAVYVQPTPYIVICPPFWDQPMVPPMPTTKNKHLICPAWNPLMQQVDPRGPFELHTFGYQVFSLIQQGVHFYEHESLGTGTTPKEVWQWRDMTRLAPADKRKNPMNYAAYIAMVYLNCQLDKTAELLPEHLNAGATIQKPIRSRPIRLQKPPRRPSSSNFKPQWDFEDSDDTANIRSYNPG